jgi:hypothetical protein
MFKRIIYISITVLFLLQIGNYFPIFKIKQWEIRKNIELIIKKNVDNSALKVISIPTNYPLKWEREGREFWFEGSLYDIVRSEIKDSTTHYYCINDTKETELTNDYAEIVQKQINSTNNTEGSGLDDDFKKIVKIYFPIVFNLSDNSVEIGALKHLKTPIPYRCFYTSLSMNLIDPPPKI